VIHQSFAWVYADVCMGAWVYVYAYVCISVYAYYFFLFISFLLPPN